MNQDDKQENICDYLRQGMFKKDAAVMAGIDESTFYRWIKEDASFASRVEASILEYKHSLVKNLNTQAEKNGLLAFKILQSRWPKDWGPHQIDDDYQNSTKRIADILEEVIAAEEEDDESEETRPNVSANN